MALKPDHKALCVDQQSQRLDNQVMLSLLALFAGGRLMAATIELPLVSIWPGYSRGGLADSAFVIGDYVYLATHGAPTQVIQISDPARPVRVGQLQGLIQQVTSMVGSGDYVYGASSGYRYGFAVIDAHEPDKPVTLSVQGHLEVRSISISGDKLFVAGSDSGMAAFEIYDVTNPGAPEFLSRTQTAGSVLPSLAASGRHLFAAEYSGGHVGAGGLLIFDVSDPACPRQIGRLAPQYDLGRVAFVGGEHLLIIDSLFNEQRWEMRYFLQSVDISNPLDPRRLGSVEIHNLADITVAGEYAYITAEERGLQVVDVSNLAHPQLVGVHDLAGSPKAVAVSGDRAYLASGRAGLEILDVANPEDPTQLGSYVPGIALDVAILGDLAFLADGFAGLQVVDIRERREPRTIATLDVADSVTSLVASSNLVFLAGESGLHVIDVANPKSPRRLSHHATSEAVASFAVAGNTAYLAKSGAGFEIIDVSDPSNLRPLGSLESMGDVIHVAVSGDNAYLVESITETIESFEAYRGTILAVVDISDPAHPRRMGSYLGSYDAETSWCSSSLRDIAVVGRYAFVAVEDTSPGSYANNGSLQVFDVSQAEWPELVGEVPMAGDAFRLRVQRGRAYVSFADDYGSIGFWAFDITNPRLPVREGFFELSPAWPYQRPIPGMAVVDDHVYFACEEMGMAIVDLFPLFATPHLISGSKGHQIKWDSGVLQYSPTTEGPWTDLPAASPFPLSPIGDKGFFRVRAEP